MHAEYFCVLNIINSIHKFLLLVRGGMVSFGKHEGDVISVLLNCSFGTLAAALPCLCANTAGQLPVLQTRGRQDFLNII